MLRSFLSVFLAATMAVFGTAPVAYGQYGPPGAPDPQYSPQQYPQSYPQQYPQGSGYPQGPQYPQGGYPQGYPPAGQSAQYPPPQGNMQEPGESDPAADRQHGVARLSIVQGDVNMRRGDDGQLVAAIMNAPVMTQDQLQTSPGSRAEVELDYGNLVRLAPNTELGFADMEYHRYQLQLGAGTIIYRVLRNANSQVEIDTPSIAIRPAVEGEYRISVLEDGTTQLSVRSGQAEIYSPRGSQYVTAGHTVLVRGNPSDPEFQQTYEMARDQFDDWSANRDRDLLASQSYQHVSNDVDGADDLDAYGNWVPSQYGQVWAPRPPVADWSPYSYGQWAWEGYYGWTWVDYAPWGWAPYHYGRWFWNGGYGWCWWPGAIAARYLWSPALVGFFGFGTGVGLALAGLGWVALAPFELFHAWWGHGFGFRPYGGYGFGRGVNIAAMYRNAAFRGGAMTAAYNSFGGPNHRFEAATRGQLANASLFRGQIPVSPTRASYQFTNRQAVGNSRLASAGNRQFFEHEQPRYAAGANGARFAAAQSGVRGGASNLSNGYAGGYARGSNYGVRSQSPSSGGWQRFGDPSNNYRQSTGAQEESGWHRFGAPQPSAPAYNGGRNFNQASRPNYSGSYSGAYTGRSNYGAPTSRYNAPSEHYSAPASHYSAPSQHYSAPSRSYHGGGGGSAHGGGHSSSGGHHGR